MSDSPWRARLKALLHALWQWPLALLILFEEWGWEPLQRLLAWVGAWPGFRQLEAWVRRLPPYGALALFALPSLALLPIKLLALWAVGHGHGLLGLLVIVGAKLGGTAVVARLFTLTQPALMRLAWFARLHGRWVPWKEALLARVRASAPWRLARRLRIWLRLRLGRTTGRTKGQNSDRP
ncbi:hypothetical protein [Ideonella dechloratans]|uniref:hypothetical protein n=1 Tax=Ideonella dechloratans TaxID=36863 RepID=UPI0035B0B3E8